MMHSVRQVLALVLMCAALAVGCMDNPTPTVVAPTPVVQHPASPTPPPTPPQPFLTPSLVPTATVVDEQAKQPSHIIRPLNLGIPTGNTYDVQAAVVDYPRGLLYVLGRQDATTENLGSVSVIDLAQSAVRSTIALTTTIDYNASLAVSADGTLLFILGSPERRETGLVVIESGVGGTQAGRVAYSRGSVHAFALDAPGNRLYVLEGNTLSAINAKTFAVEGSTTVSDLTPPPPPTILVINRLARRLYIVFPTSIVSVYDAQGLNYLGDLKLDGRIKSLLPHLDRPDTYAIVESLVSGVVSDKIIVLQDNRIATSWPGDVTFTIGRITLDDSNGQLLVLEDARDVQVQQSRIRAIDPATGTVIRSTPLPYLSLAYSRNSLAYRGTLYDVADVILPITLANGHIGKAVHTGINLVGAALDGDTQRLYILDSAGTIHTIDTRRFTETAVWPSVVDPGRQTMPPIPLTVAAGKLYVPDAGQSATLVLDAASGKHIGTINRWGAVSVDVRRNIVYVTNQGVYTANGDTYQITGQITATIRQTAQFVSPGAIAATYDEGFDWIFVTMSNNSPGSSNRSWLEIYDGATQARISSTIQTDLQFLSGLAPDATTKRVWIAGSFPSHSLTAFEQSGQIRTRLRGLGNHLFLNSARQHLYVFDWDGIVTIDTKTDTVIGYHPLPVAQPAIMLYDRAQQRFYINSTGSARLLPVYPDDPVTAAHSVMMTLPSQRVQELHSDASGEVIVSMPAIETSQLRLFRQSNAGWLPIDEYLPATMRPRLVTAPDITGAIFAFSENVQYSSGFFRSTDGGRTWQLATRGLNDFRVTALALSPTFGKDGLGLLLTTGRTVYQTRDHGETWTRLPDLTGSYIGLTSVGGQTLFVILSPDQHVVTQTTLYRGTSERILQQTVSLPVPSYSVAGFAVSPDSTQGNASLLVARGDALTGRPDALYLSTDFGQTWQLATALTPVNSLSAIILYSPTFASDRTIYALITPSFYRFDDRSILLRSLDGGQHWERSMNADPTICAAAMMPNGQIWTGNIQGIIRQLNPASLVWQAYSPPLPTPTPTTRPSPTSAPTPPRPTVVPTPVLFQPDPIFEHVYRSGREIRGMVGLATEPQARDVWVAIQLFEKGQMLWRQDTRTIYVLPLGASWTTYQDTWTEDQPEQDPTIVPPQGKLQPKRGFGKVWRTIPNVREQMGWALQAEQGFTAKLQNFQYGLMARIGDKTYLIGELYDRLTWTIR